MEQALRVAFFPDTYDEIDGVANTSRQFEAFAKRRGLPFLIICGGAREEAEQSGSVSRLMLRRGPIAFPLDKNHDYDLLFWRYYSRLLKVVRRFSPDVVHITGPSEVGQMGALIAHRLGIPLAASWHTNLHEYAERRSLSIMSVLPESFRAQLGAQIRRASLGVLLRFYRIAQCLFAPNPELMDLLRCGTGKPVHAMARGVDLALFTPARRTRIDDQFVIGYVGRLTTEKNIRFLAELERRLLEAGLTNFRFSIVGQGAEEEWLRANMRTAQFEGVLKGESLARAYANMDAFAFPSRTDTFGNVVLEALACGVPAVVTDQGGPQFIIRDGETGLVARNSAEFVGHVMRLASDANARSFMGTAARVAVCQANWNVVFSSLYASYEHTLRTVSITGKILRVRPQPTVGY